MMALPYILPGITVISLGSAVAAAIILGIANAVVRPILQFLSIPLTLLTFGLFYFVVNGAMVMLTSGLVPGFYVNGWWTAIIAAAIISAANSFFLKKQRYTF